MLTELAVAALVLGSPEYVPNSGAGWGTPAPPTISNGGVPNGVVREITWNGWGRPTATGRGTGSIYRPQGGYYPPVRVQLKVSDVGTCPGREEQAYRTLMARMPQWPGGPLGGWFKWSGSRTVCDYDEQGPSTECKSVGEYAQPGTVQSIDPYRMRCAVARRIARQIKTCAASGCTQRISGTRCRLERVRRDEYVGFDDQLPVQRVVCRRSGAYFSAFLVRRG